MSERGSIPKVVNCLPKARRIVGVRVVTCYGKRGSSRSDASAIDLNEGVDILTVIPDSVYDAILYMYPELRMSVVLSCPKTY